MTKDPLDIDLEDEDFSTVEDGEETPFPEEPFPPQQTPAPVPKQDALPAPVPAVSFDLAALMKGTKGIKVGDLGLTVSRYPVEKMKFTAGQRTVINIITNQVIAIKTHFTQAHGNFLCFNGECCDLDTPRVRYLFPIIVYDTDSKGRVVSRDIKHRVLVLGQETYDSLILSADFADGDISSVDLVVTCSDEQYQKISIHPAKGETRWRRDANMAAEIQEFWTKNMAGMIKSVAKEMTPAQYRHLLPDEGDVSPVAAASTFDDVFGG